MRDKQSKKVVIINDINSETIEQAILILRNNGVARTTTAGSHIVAEAGNIINSYIKTVEKTEKGLESSKTKKKNRPLLRLFIALAAVCSFFASAYGISRLFEMITEKF